jgi:hypothetical protein
MRSRVWILGTRERQELVLRLQCGSRGQGPCVSSEPLETGQALTSNCFWKMLMRNQHFQGKKEMSGPWNVCGHPLSAGFVESLCLSTVIG